MRDGGGENTFSVFLRLVSSSAELLIQARLQRDPERGGGEKKGFSALRWYHPVTSLVDWWYMYGDLGL